MKFNIMACVALCLAIQACSGGSAKDNTADLAEIPVMKIQPQDTSLFTDYVADIQSVQHVELRSRMHGFIEKVLVDEGQEVRKGQLLFQLNDKEYNIALNKAKANLASAISAARIAEVELERIRTLVEKKVISPSELSLGEARKAEAEASIKTARSVIEDANQKLTYARVRAPFSGRIDRLPLKSGSLVEEGSLLTTLSDSRRMYAYFDVSENEYLQFVRKGVPGKCGMVYLNVQFKIFQQAILAQKAYYCSAIIIVLVLGRLAGLRLNEESSGKAIAAGVAFSSM